MHDHASLLLFLSITDNLLPNWWDGASMVCMVGKTYSFIESDTKKEKGTIHKQIVKYARI